jgi:hypothetical protein
MVRGASPGKSHNQSLDVNRRRVCQKEYICKVRHMIIFYLAG